MQFMSVLVLVYLYICFFMSWEHVNEAFLVLTLLEGGFECGRGSIICHGRKEKQPSIKYNCYLPVSNSIDFQGRLHRLVSTTV